MEWMAGDTYSELWRSVIRPSRWTYQASELGPPLFRLGEKDFERKDLQLKNGRGQVLECSHFASATGERQPCVVFCHGNSSCRLEALRVVPYLLLLDVGVFCMDFSGSGNSEGEYISLGLQEEKDLAVAIRHLRRSGRVTSVGLWGRSMGAATAILRAAKDRCIAGCVLDSPFVSLRVVAEELVGQAVSVVPQFVLDMALEMVRGECVSRAGFDPDAVLPKRSAPLAKCPAFFGVAHDDNFVLPHHTQDLYDAWGGERCIRRFGGGHNGDRPAEFMREAARFLALQLRCEGGGMQVVPLPPPDSLSTLEGHEHAFWLPLLPPVERELAREGGAPGLGPRRPSPSRAPWPGDALRHEVFSAEAVPPDAFSVRRTMRKAVLGAVRHARRRARVPVKRRAASERPCGAYRGTEPLLQPEWAPMPSRHFCSSAGSLRDVRALLSCAGEGGHSPGAAPAGGRRSI